MNGVISRFRTISGFTLVELIVIMIVIAILAVVALPRFSLLKGFDEVGYRDQVKATLEYARKAAVAQRRYSCVQLSGSSLVATIDTGIPEGRAAIDTSQLPSIVLICPRQQALMLPGNSSNSISPRGSTTLTGTAAVVFDALGRPWTASSATLSSQAQFTVQGETNSTITVEAETGYVH